MALMLIFVISLALLIFQVIKQNKLLNAHAVSLIVGLLWSAHIVIKNSQLTDNHSAFLSISLLSILLIYAIAFINNFISFLFGTVPVSCTVLWLAGQTNTLNFVLVILLPVLGIVIHYILQRRNDAFTQRLIEKLIFDKRKYSDLSMLDPLTELYNRRGLLNRLENMPSGGNGKHYLLLMDIDRFKSYNDHYGHSMGDQALIAVATAIRDAVRSRDVVARYGGEEFLVLLTNIDGDYALRCAERIRERVFNLNISHQYNESDFSNITISIGITPLGEDGFEQALLNADVALYRAKDHGRNRILSVNMEGKN